jgi:DMSO/TMAO reductase YedYZ molybdopterin-dependent catalytic subunit
MTMRTIWRAGSDWSVPGAGGRAGSGTGVGGRLAAVVCVGMLLLAASIGSCGGDTPGDAADAVDMTEVREYQGLPLDTYFRTYDNSIRGPQAVDIETYRLRIDGLVDRPVELTYDEVLALPTVQRAITLYCVEGWAERLLFEGVRVADLLALAGPREAATTIIFHALDDYTTSLPYEDVDGRDLMLAAKINGRVLDEMRGFPFQLVAEDKLGYKWIKWIDRIELTAEPYAGFWETRGYSNEAGVPAEWHERTMRKAPK